MGLFQLRPTPLTGFLTGGPSQSVLEQTLVGRISVGIAIVPQGDARNARFGMFDDENHREVFVF